VHTNNGRCNSHVNHLQHRIPKSFRANLQPPTKLQPNRDEYRNGNQATAGFETSANIDLRLQFI
jgi:hypothetical protein